jgi:hypothetical protein
MAGQVRQRFPGIVFHSSLDAVRGIAAAEYAGLRPEVLDGSPLKDLAGCQVATLYMMDRMDALGSFHFHERVRLYHRLLAYWLSVLDETQPEIVIFCEAPHLVYDYVLYCLCEQKGIRTVMFEFTRVNGLLFPTASIEGETPVMQVYQRLLADYRPGCAHISAASEDHLKAASGAYEALPAHLQPFLSGFGGEMVSGLSGATLRPLLSQRLVRLLRKPAVLAWRLCRMKAPPNYMKQTGRKIEESWMTGLKYTLYRRRSRRKMHQLAALYQRLAEKPDLTKPYVYVPLAYQPERSTSPLGGVFVNQLLMVDLLSRCLPEGWYLYVKEHPTQFYCKQAFRAQSGRTKDTYDDLAALPSVKLVDMSVSSFDLTDSSRAVAAVVSTACWEAVIRGKPAMVFGYPWYRGCEGVFQSHTREECLEALRKITEGYQVDQGKVRLFIQALEQVGFTGYVEPYLADVAAISPEENAEAIAQALKRFAATISEPLVVKK